MSTLYSGYAKRILDFLLALSGLVVLSPVLVSIAFALFFRGVRPIFVQIRPGFGGRPFPIFKFRTMTDETDQAGNLLPDALRVTLFGQFLRTSSLDELPQLYNVLTGDMSIVGPRPLLMEYLAIYTDTERTRHSVKPGITGLAQINGGQHLSWEKKMKLDILYAQNVSFRLDMRIIISTLKKWLTAKRVDALSVVVLPDNTKTIEEP